MQIDLFPNVNFTPVRPVLRPYQASAIERIKDAASRGKRRILVCSPTGSGKMVLAARILSGAFGRALFVAHRGELLNQCAFQLAQFGVTDIGIIKADDKRANPHAPIQVASQQTLTNRDAGTFELIVIDECHSDRYAELFKQHPDALFIGLTATPFRLNGDGLTEYEELIIVAKPSELVRDGHICEPHMRGADTIGLSDVSFVAGEYHNGELAEKMSGPAIVGDIVDTWRKYGQGYRTVCFAVNVAHSKHIVTQFLADGVRAAHLDGNTKQDERTRILVELEANKLDVVSTCDVLSEGWDQPSVKCAILARPTMSLRLHMQQGGRVLRPWQGVTPIILDHAGNLMRHGTFTEDRDFTLEGGVKREKSVSLKTCKRCYLIWSGASRTCSECGWEMPAPAERSEVQTIAGELLGHTPENAARNDFIRLATRAKEQGFKPGFAGAKWKEKHGKWPPWAWSQQLANAYANDPEWQQRQSARQERANYWKEKNNVPMAPSERTPEEANGFSDYATEDDIPF